MAYDGSTPTGAGTRVVQLSVSEIGEAPAARNSRVRDDDHALDELAASIRRHGLLQPIIVRPSGTDDLPTGPRYIVIAGSRRLRAARRANLSSVACLIRVTNADDAFILNVVENLQRRELSGCERIRAITLLASLTDELAHPLGVRAISRRTGLAPSTISRWLRIDRQPALKAALEQERLDIGRAMQLVGAPEEQLGQLIERAPTVPQAQLAHEVEALGRDSQVLAGRRAAADRRRAEAAERALRLIEDTPEPVRVILERIGQRLETLLRHCST